MIHSQLGAYRVHSDLGSGGMGNVYLAENTDLPADAPEERRLVAVKVVHPHLLETPGTLRRFMQEAEIGKRVRHENVVRTFDAGAAVVDGREHHFLVMEYVRGRSLRELVLELGVVPEALLREIAKQIAAGLAAIHAAGVIHRDIKPENVLITDADEIRIMDLGVAKLQEATLAITRAGQFAGSLCYAAPEQFGSEDVGPSADIYSLGVLLYELATGEPPFVGEDVGAMIQAHLTQTPVMANERNEAVSPWLAEVLAKLLAKQPARRFESAETIRAVFEQGDRSSWWADCATAVEERAARLPRLQVNRETRLHGRDDALRALQNARDRAFDGEGNTIFIEGEAGIGKTRLIDELLRETGARDCHLLYGSYPPSGGMGGLTDAILGKFGEVRLADALAPYLTVTPSLVPTFAAQLKHERVQPDVDPLAGDALQAVVVHLMRALAAEKPTIWVLDDLHFAPRESHDFFLAMARAVEDHRILLLATARPGVGLEDFGRLGNFARLPLDRLGARQIFDLLEDAFGGEALAEELGGKIAKKSDGVPFFIFEMIRGLKDGQFITQRPDGTYAQTQVIEEIEVPSAVKDLIEGRMRGLTENQRAILDAGAVCGLTFEPALVAQVVEEKRVRVLRELAEIERRHGLVRGEEDHVRFDQNQIQEVLYGDLMPDLRREYHTLLAESYAERHGEGPTGDDAVFLVQHYLRGNRPKRASAHLESAFEHLEQGYRNDALLDLGGRALKIDGLLDGADRVRVLLRLAGRFELLGRREEQRAAVEEAVALADAAGDEALRARAWSAQAGLLIAVSANDDAKAAIERALDLAHAAGDEQVELRARGQLGNICLRLGRHAEAQQHLEQALALSREAGDRQGEANITCHLGNVFYGLGRYAEAERYYERYGTLCRAVGDRRGESIAAGNLGAILGNAGRWAQAQEHFERNRTLSREIGYRQGEALATECLGGLSRRLGRFSDSREHHERARGLCREVGDRILESYVLASLGALAESEGNPDDAERYYEEALDLRREIGAQAGVAEIIADLSRLTAAKGHVDDAVARAEEALALAVEGRNPAPILSATIERAGLPGGDVEAAVAALVEHEEGLEHPVKMNARFRLWELTRDKAHLEEAHRLLRFMRDHAPEQDRDAMIENVPLHRAITEAWAEHGSDGRRWPSF
ncbi:MAG: protein kinase domain-containing protein [Planctomycetota bacterium]|jgi:tetratricopeptide (TPR) repeat protein